MNLRKLGYFYLPAIAIGFALAAIIFDYISHIPLKPIIFGIIAMMVLIIYFGFRQGIHRE